MGLYIWAIHKIYIASCLLPTWLLAYCPSPVLSCAARCLPTLTGTGAIMGVPRPPSIFETFMRPPGRATAGIGNSQ